MLWWPAAPLDGPCENLPPRLVNVPLRPRSGAESNGKIMVGKIMEISWRQATCGRAVRSHHDFATDDFATDDFATDDFATDDFAMLRLPPSAFTSNARSGCPAGTPARKRSRA
jgi:hypothetical protein